MTTSIAQQLAIHGGRPVRDQFLVFGAPCLGEEEIDEVVATLRSGWIGTGPRAKQFEEEFATYVGARYAVSLNSCTAGLFLALKALGVGSGDAVLTTPLTFGATANVIEHVGARPVFVDIDPHTLNLDLNHVEAELRRRHEMPFGPGGRLKVIMPVHFGGLPCAMDELFALASNYGLAIVEDAAHSIGARYKGRMVGAIGHITAFSFYANKNLTTAEGGMVTTDDPELEERLRIYRLHGLSRDAWKRFGTRRMATEVLVPGYKFNMPDLAAAIGIHQLRKQEQFLAIREQYAQIYDEAFADLPVEHQQRPNITTIEPEHPPQNRHALHLYVLILKEDAFRVSRNEIVDALLAENIGASIHYRAAHIHHWYRKTYGYRPDDFPVAYRIGEHTLSLPLTPGMNERDVQDVITAVRKVLGAHAR
ncbi:MAG: DegT/DnrJ/EryC1/StrS family aminotransferase [Oscillochloridaceae bacterium umkhey_bin13]